jgi:hypothetical protein
MSDAADAGTLSQRMIHHVRQYDSRISERDAVCHLGGLFSQYA